MNKDNESLLSKLHFVCLFVFFKLHLPSPDSIRRDEANVSVMFGCIHVNFLVLETFTSGSGDAE